MSRAGVGLCALLLAVFPGGWAAAKSPETGAPPPAGAPRDPFIPLVRDGRLLNVASRTPRQGDVPLSLSGIVWEAGGKSIALINETELRVGDTILEYRVTDIQPDRVLLVRDGESVALQIAFDEPMKPKQAP